MNTREKDKIYELAKLLKIIPSEEALRMLQEEYDSIIKRLEKIKSIDVSEVKPLSHLNEKAIFLLREDEVEETKTNKTIVLKNAKNSNEDYVVIGRVIND